MIDYLDKHPNAIDFLEVAPENWIGVGGRYDRKLRQLTDRYPLTLHGLSLNVGGFSPLDNELLSSIKGFITEFDCPIYSEHLSYCGDEGQMYDLNECEYKKLHLCLYTWIYKVDF